jgi:hypothetical protein
MALVFTSHGGPRAIEIWSQFTRNILVLGQEGRKLQQNPKEANWVFILVQLNSLPLCHVIYLSLVHANIKFTSSQYEFQELILTPSCKGFEVDLVD